MVYGNHDYDDDIRPFEVMLQSERVRLLHNESVVLEQEDGSRIRLAGVDDPRTKRDRLKIAISEPEDGDQLFTLLLAHDPAIAFRMGKSDSIDLVLCGHTHGGQVALPFIGPVMRWPFGQTYWRGWFDLPKRETTGAWLPRLLLAAVMELLNCLFVYLPQLNCICSLCVLRRHRLRINSKRGQ